MRITIIGGGVIGLCTAFYLRKQGHEVSVVDGGNITEGCSFGNMGYVSPSHFIPLASPGIVSKGLKWMLSASSPFYIKPRIDLDLIRWGIQFWKSSEAQKSASKVRPLLSLLQLSRELMKDFIAVLPNSFGYTEKGCFMLYKSKSTEEHEKKLALEAEKLGLKVEVCSSTRVQELETQVETNVAGGVLYFDDCHLNSSLFMKELYDHLKNSGVQFYLNTKVSSFEKKNDKVRSLVTDKITLKPELLVVANGSWMPQIASMLGFRLLMQPGKGYSIVYQSLNRNLQFPSILVDDRTATTPINDWLRIGGTMELSGHSDNILPKRVLAIHRAFGKYYPKMNLPEPDHQKAWYGYRPVTPDGLPYIGRKEGLSNVFFAGGHAMLGVSAAAGTGQLIRELIEGKKTSVDINAFAIDRFD